MKIKYSNKLKLDKNYSCIHFGKYTESNYDIEENESDIEIVKSIDEYTFYYLYCNIHNITAEKKIPDSLIIVLCTLMCKDIDYTLPIDNKDGKLTDIAKQLSTEDKEKTSNAIYLAVKKLKDSGYLVLTEDNFIVPNANFQRIRQIVKKQLSTNGYATFDYVFKSVIVNG